MNWMSLKDSSNSSILWVQEQHKQTSATELNSQVSLWLSSLYHQNSEEFLEHKRVINERWLKSVFWQILTQSREDSWEPSALRRGPITALSEHKICLQILFLWSYKNCREMPDFFKLWIIISSWSLLNGLLRSVNTSICLFSNFFPLEERVSMLRNHSPELFPTHSNVLGHWAEKG